MRHHPCQDFEPLLKGSNSSLMRQIPTKKEISESIHREQSILGSKFRSTSITRWYIIFGIGLSWLSTYFNSISPIYLKNEIINELHLNYVDYSYMISITYILSVFTPLLIPRILLFFNGSSIISLICIQFISLSGQILFYLGIEFFNYNDNVEDISNVNIILIYIGRILIGMSLGCSDSIILSILIFWFQKSQNMSFVSTFICIATMLSVIIGRLCIESISEVSLSISSSFILPILINFGSIWILFAVNCIKNKNIPPIYDQMILRDFYNNGNILKKFKQITNILWLIILNTSLLLSLMNILYTMFIPNILSEIYNFTEKESFIILLLTLIFFILWSLPISYIMDYYGYYIQWNILSSFLFFLSVLFLFFGANNNQYIGGQQNKLYAIISLSILSISTLCISSHFTLTILSTKPIELAPYIASIITVLHWFFTVIFNDVISWLDSIHTVNINNSNRSNVTYLDSILFILFISFLQFAISAMVYGITVKSELNLHHPTPNKIDYNAANLSLLNTSSNGSYHSATPPKI